MNDPNGMVYNDGIYHLFFQYYPDSTVWGPMHWGHATSTDLTHWVERPIALYPDSIGYIFSGSAVVDKNNTSGFGRNGVAPLVAVFTQHDAVAERNGSNSYETQGIAYSLDNGKTWTKYTGNPVVKNPGVRDFRDPKVIWDEEGRKWIMILAVKDHIEIFSSPDLRNWNKESEFGKEIGAHGGVWECPDIFPLVEGNRKFWVLIVNINPGGPNGGSATQYFVGNFNGREFSTGDTTTKWADYGPDEYAGVTWSNTGDRQLFLGWMSNWDYAQVVPAGSWRSATTCSREIQLKTVAGKHYIALLPANEIDGIAVTKRIIRATDIRNKSTRISSPCLLQFSMRDLKEFTCEFSNDKGESLVAGFDQSTNRYYIDRSKVGRQDFHEKFGQRSFGSRIAQTDSSSITIVLDNSSIEFFADGGLTVLTSIFFTRQPFNSFSLRTEDHSKSINIRYTILKSIWRK